MESVRLHLKSGCADAEPSSSQLGAPAASDKREAAKTHNNHKAIYNDPLWFTTAIEPADVDDGIYSFFDGGDGLLGDITIPDECLSFDFLNSNNVLNQDWDWLKQSGLLGLDAQDGEQEAASSNTSDRHCDECDKDFKYPKDYRRHVQSVHNDERPLKCPVDRCKYHHKGFAREDNRKRHIEKLHPGVASTIGVVYDL